MSTDNSIHDAAQAGRGSIDSRYHLAAGMRRQINKVFPTHWSFLLGEIALYSFIILLISGVYLTLFFDPSMATSSTTASTSRSAASRCPVPTRPP